MGTLLQKLGMPAGISPEAFGWEHPETIRKVHKAYLDAGARILTTNTFGGSRYKLEFDVDATAFNRAMAEQARSVAGDNAWVAGSVGPTGHFVRPHG